MAESNDFDDVVDVVLEEEIELESGKPGPSAAEELAVAWNCSNVIFAVRLMAKIVPYWTRVWRQYHLVADVSLTYASPHMHVGSVVKSRSHCSSSTRVHVTHLDLCIEHFLPSDLPRCCPLSDVYSSEVSTTAYSTSIPLNLVFLPAALYAHHERVEFHVRAERHEGRV